MCLLTGGFTPSAQPSLPPRSQHVLNSLERREPKSRGHSSSSTSLKWFHTLGDTNDWLKEVASGKASVGSNERSSGSTDGEGKEGVVLEVLVGRLLNLQMLGVEVASESHTSVERKPADCSGTKGGATKPETGGLEEVDDGLPAEPGGEGGGGEEEGSVDLLGVVDGRVVDLRLDEVVEGVTETNTHGISETSNREEPDVRSAEPGILGDYRGSLPTESSRENFGDGDFEGERHAEEEEIGPRLFV